MAQPLATTPPAKGTILITGCSSGIGYDAAHTLKTRGWRVYATCRKAEDVARLTAEGLESFALDVSSSDSIAQAMVEVEARGGRLDALFNNAAFACPGAVEDLPRGALEEIFATNLFGLHELTRAALPIMRRQGSGRIINNSSVLGLVGMRWRGAYVATKFALEGLSDVLRLEMRGTGVEVCLIEPGPIPTKFRDNAIPHFEKWIDWQNSARAADYDALRDRHYNPKGPDRFELPPSAVTQKLIEALESPRPKARYFVTHATTIMGCLRRILPTRLLDALVARL